MQNLHDHHSAAHTIDTDYEMPELTFIGDADKIVLGVPGGGYDGDACMTEHGFEFESDGLD